MKSYQMIKKVTHFLALFLWATLSFNSASVLLNFFMNRSSNVTSILLNTCKHHRSETFFISTFFCPSVDLGLFMLHLCDRSISYFHLHFHYDWPYNLINSGKNILLTLFQNMPYYFRTKNVNNFLISKSWASGDC